MKCRSEKTKHCDAGQIIENDYYGSQKHMAYKKVVE